jgi:Ca-activated chloride channel homolog
MVGKIKAKSIFVLLWLLTALWLFAQSKGTSESPPYTISLNVDLVVLDITVVDGHGKFLPGLGSQHFKIYEDGHEEKISYFLSKDVPATIGVVIDNSGSLRRKRAEIVAAAMEFVEGSNPHDEMFIVHFNENVTFGLPPGEPFTNNPLQLRAALLRMAPAGQTALYDAVSRASIHATKGKPNRRALLVISDGGDNASHAGLKETLQIVRSSNVVLYTISLSDPSNRDQKPGVLRKLSKTSGGESFFPKELREVGPLCQTIATSIRNQYLLAYRPSNAKRDGTFRRVRVTVHFPNQKDLAVRTREGYLAPNEDDARSSGSGIQEETDSEPLKR